MNKSICLVMLAVMCLVGCRKPTPPVKEEQQTKQKMARSAFGGYEVENLLQDFNAKSPLWNEFMGKKIKVRGKVYEANVFPPGTRRPEGYTHVSIGTDMPQRVNTFGLTADEVGRLKRGSTIIVEGTFASVDASGIKLSSCVLVKE